MTTTAQPPSTPNFKFNLGDFVKDEITGFEGVIIAQCLWLNGSRNYMVQGASLNRDNETTRPEPIDEVRLSHSTQSERHQQARGVGRG